MLREIFEDLCIIKLCGYFFQCTINLSERSANKRYSITYLMLDRVKKNCKNMKFVRFRMQYLLKFIKSRPF